MFGVGKIPLTRSMMGFLLGRINTKNGRVINVQSPPPHTGYASTHDKSLVIGVSNYGVTELKETIQNSDTLPASK